MGREKITFDMSFEDILLTMAEGNIGAANVVMEILATKESIMALLLCDSLGIRGYKLYMLYNDCCSRDIDKFMQTLRMFQQGIFSIEDIDACLDLPKAIPFVDDTKPFVESELDVEDYEIAESYRKRLREAQDKINSSKK